MTGETSEETQNLGSTVMDRDSIKARVEAGNTLAAKGEERRTNEASNKPASNESAVTLSFKDKVMWKIFGKKKQVLYQGAENDYMKANPNSTISQGTSGDEYDEADLAKLAKMSPAERQVVAARTQAVMEGMQDEVRAKGEAAETAVVPNKDRLNADQAHSKMQRKIQNFGSSGQASDRV